jgi:hypothetical protein
MGLSPPKRVGEVRLPGYEWYTEDGLCPSHGRCSQRPRQQVPASPEGGTRRNIPVFCESAFLNTTPRSAFIAARQAIRYIMAVIRSETGSAQGQAHSKPHTRETHHHFSIYLVICLSFYPLVGRRGRPETHAVSWTRVLACDRVLGWSHVPTTEHFGASFWAPGDSHPLRESNCHRVLEVCDN